MKERFKYIPSIVMLLAGFISCIVTMVCKYEILEALIVILVTLIIFYIIGIVIKALFNRFLISDESVQDADDESKDDTSQENSEENIEEDFSENENQE